MDVMRVDTADGQRRFCCCVAAYGYMGDLMAASEGLRWAGPGRYNIAGALSLLRNKVSVDIAAECYGICSGSSSGLGDADGLGAAGCTTAAGLMALSAPLCMFVFRGMRI